MPEVPRPGIGIASMRDRAAELSGTLRVVPAEPGPGTVVEAVLPVERT